MANNQYSNGWLEAATAFNNPWSALGALLGNVWIKDREDRGERKLYDSMQGSVPGAPTDAQNVQASLAAAPTQQQTAQDTIFSNYQKANPIQSPAGNAYEVGLSALQNQTTSPLERAALEQAIGSNTPVQGGNAQASLSPEETQAFQSYLSQNTPQINSAGQVSNVPDPSQVAKAAPAEFSMDDWKARVWAEGKKQGRPDNQIQAVIDSMTPEAEAAEKRWKDYQSDIALNDVLSSIPTDANDPRQIQLYTGNLMKLYQTDPERAKLLMQQTPNGNDFYRTITEKQKADRQQQWAQQAAATQYQRQQAAANAEAERNLRTYQQERDIDRANKRGEAEDTIELKQKYGIPLTSTSQKSAGGTSSGSRGNGSPTEMQSLALNLGNGLMQAISGQDLGQIHDATYAIQHYLYDEDGNQTEAGLHMDPSAREQLLRMLNAGYYHYYKRVKDENQAAQYAGNIPREYWADYGIG